MLVADSYLGNVAEERVATRVERAESLSVTLSDTERRRSRVRTTTDDGTDLGIVVPEPLSDGDVLSADDSFVVVSLAAVEAMVLTFDDSAPPARALELGHAIGNRHWDLAVETGRVLVPVVESRERMEALVDSVLPDRTAVTYETVPPTTFDDGQQGHVRDRDHTHDHGRGSDYVDGRGHGHGHTHDHQHDHGHDHDRDDHGHDAEGKHGSDRRRGEPPSGDPGDSA